MSNRDVVTRLNTALEGRYRIERQLGEGGMATVYVADDLKHERKVALKVLKPELAAVVGAERFLAEIKTTANLQHPHILPLFDSGQAGGFLFYVMPYVEGESLRDRLDRERQLPVDEAVQIAIDVAGALDYAHRHGVIHRDIKPANILLHDGQPVVSDFGIALAVSAGGGGRLTETGLSLGTPHYMSPEQATGDLTVGPAADVYALGCVLYEMLVGEPPYTGSTAQAILGKIVTGEPDAVTKHRKAVPAHVEAVIRRALERIPADRFTGAGELARALADPGFRHAPAALGRRASGVARSSAPWRRALPWGLATAFAVVALIVGARPPAETPGGVVRFTVPIPFDEDAGPEARLPFERYAFREVAISPDGESIVYRSWIGTPSQGQYQLYMRRLDQETAVRLATAEGGAVPTFSPDGTWLAYLRIPANAGAPTSRTLERMSVADGRVEVLATVPGLLGMTWGDDGTIVLGNGNALYSVPATGGELDTIARADPGPGEFIRYGEPWMLPGSRALLFQVKHSFDPADADIVALDLATGAQKIILSDAMVPMYLPSGHLLFVRRATLMAVRFDLDRLQVVGQPVAMADDLMQALYAPDAGRESGATQVAVSANGHLVYAAGGMFPEIPATVAQVTSQGDTIPLQLDERQYFAARVSPDGARLAVGSNHGQESQIWIRELSRPVARRLDTGGFTNSPFEWSPDGQSLVFSSTIDQPVRNLYRVRADGGAPPERLTESSENQFVESVSPRGIIAFTSGGDIWTLAPDGNAEPFFTSPETNEVGAVFSPNGEWLAYTSDETGRDEVYVRPYPGPGPATLITDGGARHPTWSWDGGQLHYLAPNGTLMAIDVTLGVELHVVGSPRALVLHADGPFLESYPRSYDVHTDGSFFMVVPQSIPFWEGFTTELHVVLNFGDEVRQRLPS